MIEKQQQLKDEVKRLLEQAEAADEAEDREYGDKRGDELPEELRRRETRLARIKEAKKVLEQRARDKALAEGKSAEEAKLAKPQDKDQYNFTDPESRIMPGADGIVQGYNAQAAVEPTLLLIVGQTVTEASNDKRQLKPMVELIEQQSGQRPKALLADNGYCSEENLEFLASNRKPEHKIEGFIATGKESPASIGSRPSAVRCRRARRGWSGSSGNCRPRRAKLSTRRASAWWSRYSGRSSRHADFVDFSLRGKEKVKGEWALLCLTHNILRLHAAMQY